MHRFRHRLTPLLLCAGFLAGGAAPLKAQEIPDKKPLLVSSIVAQPDPATHDTPTIVSYPEPNRLLAAATNPDPASAPSELEGGNGGTPVIANRPVWTLKDCLDMGLRQNPDILIAKKGIEGAAGGVITARAAFLPQVSTQGLYQHREQGFLGQGDADLRDRDYYVTLRITENLWTRAPTWAGCGSPASPSPTRCSTTRRRSTP